MSECQLFLEFPFNPFFFSPLLLQSSTPSFHFTSQNLMRTLIIFFFLTLFLFFFFFFSLNYYFFFLLWILAQTTTLKQTNQIPSWNTMDKGYKKERLIKRLNRVTSDNVSRKKKQNTYMAQSRKKWPNLISQRLV